MAMFYMFVGILLFPRIIADEIKIYENGSVHWIRDGNIEDVAIWKKINDTVSVYNGTEKVLVAKNTEMKYMIDSPLTTTIGRLIKETKIEGCQSNGCNIILRFANGTVFYEKRINKSIDKIIIDLGSGKGH